MEVRFPQPFYDALSTGSGRAIIASSHENQYSYVLDDGTLSRFTKHLSSEALRGEAGVRGDGYVHILDVFHYVSKAMVSEQPPQTPILKADKLDSNSHRARTWRPSSRARSSSACRRPQANPRRPPERAGGGARIRGATPPAAEQESCDWSAMRAQLAGPLQGQSNALLRERVVYRVAAHVPAARRQPAERPDF